MNNLYYPVYKQIEKEILELSSSIYYSDDQLKVYSLKIAELILRCSVEIESIAKDIYRNKVKTEPKNPGSCLIWMEETWKLSTKEVFIVSPYFHIDSFKKLQPFNYKKDSSEDYYSSYCAIKHDRGKNLSKANLNTLIRSLAALYILILYFNNERYQLENDNHAFKLDKSAGSNIFIFSLAPCPDNTLYTSEADIIAENCIYKITRKESDYAFKIIYKNIFEETKIMHTLIGGKDFQDELNNISDSTINENFMWDFLSKYSKDDSSKIREVTFQQNKISKILSVSKEKMKASFWAELNI